MKLSDLSYLSFQSIKSRGSRFWFTVLGMAVAIGVILFLVSLGFGLQNLLFEQIATEESLLVLDVASSDSEIIPLSQNLIYELANIEGVEKVSPQLVLSGQANLGDLSSQTMFIGVDPEFFSLAGFSTNLGQIFSEEEKAVVINEIIADLFLLSPQEMIGKELIVSLFIPKDKQNGIEVDIFNIEEVFTVKGVVSQPNTIGQIYIPRKILELNGLSSLEYSLIKVKAKSSESLQSIREEIISKGLLVSALSETLDEAARIFRVVQIVLAIFGIFALIVAAIGLINTMTITLLERTNEIGIMRSIGASPVNIRLLFLVESVLTGIIGGLLGIALGFVFAELFNLLINIIARALGGQSISLFSYPVWFIISVLLLSSLVGLIAGMWPAKRAASLNPLEALRYK
jgi:putative ABC transport system permease protein